VSNSDIPLIASYCKESLKLIEPFHIEVNGLVHLDRTRTIGLKVKKQTIQGLHPFKSNILTSSINKWVNKNFRWERYKPVFSVLQTRKHRTDSIADESFIPLSPSSINHILQAFANVKHRQEVNPERDIQLCLARSSTKTTFYKNLFE